MSRSFSVFKKMCRTVIMLYVFRVTEYFFVLHVTYKFDKTDLHSGCFNLHTTSLKIICKVKARLLIDRSHIFIYCNVSLSCYMNCPCCYKFTRNRMDNNRKYNNIMYGYLIPLMFTIQC